MVSILLHHRRLRGNLVDEDGDDVVVTLLVGEGRRTYELLLVLAVTEARNQDVLEDLEGGFGLGVGILN